MTLDLSRDSSPVKIGERIHYFSFFFFFSPNSSHWGGSVVILCIIWIRWEGGDVIPMRDLVGSPRYISFLMTSKTTIMFRPLCCLTACFTSSKLISKKSRSCLKDFFLIFS
ncbi:hypothetical protein I3760_11G151700 [Carya illinoinensis]|nr:hypothetical protein I3760_11G151700 [Carya illinoinensis]